MGTAEEHVYSAWPEKEHRRVHLSVHYRCARSAILLSNLLGMLGTGTPRSSRVFFMEQTTVIKLDTIEGARSECAGSAGQAVRPVRIHRPVVR